MKPVTVWIVACVVETWLALHEHRDCVETHLSVDFVELVLEADRVIRLTPWLHQIVSAGSSASLNGGLVQNRQSNLVVHIFNL